MTTPSNDALQAHLEREDARNRRREIAIDVLLLFGLALLAAGLYMISPAALLIGVGLTLICVALLAAIFGGNA